MHHNLAARSWSHSALPSVYYLLGPTGMATPQFPQKAPPVRLAQTTSAHRSGKTSIQRVVFNKMSPHETLFLESTGSMPDAPGPEVQLIDHNPWLRLEVWDMPGDFRFEGTHQEVCSR